ncbi:MAG: hypothetical protein KDA45_15000, partial [Planctomycetales bacterium]|nr:hypothetical protein [Planctomycetales bacterium]
QGLTPASRAAAAEPPLPAASQTLQHPAIVGGQVARLDRQLWITIQNPRDEGRVTIPRLAASLQDVRWRGHEPGEELQLKVEPQHWHIQWTARPAAARVIELNFDLPPKLLTDCQPLQPAGDGSLLLPACLAATQGEKIRYEPQSFKNTVGYWVGANDRATWEFEIPRAGSYNVAVLQGCGAGQGGSRARLTVAGETPGGLLDGSRSQGGEAKSVALEFEVLETGHFQNFQWRHLGVLQLSEAGVHRLTIEPVEIRRAALMDVRAVHLIRLPQ